MSNSHKYNITEIANDLGVSISTVSRAINGKKGVGEKQRQLILDYANKIGYKPNQVSHELIKDFNRIIAVILNDIRNPFYTDLVYNIQKLLGEQGYMAVVFNSEYDENRDLELLETVQRSNFAGVILVTAQSERVEEVLNQMDMPKVLVNRILPSYKGDSVLTDNFQAGYIAVLHLLDLGHNKIGFIRGPGVSSASSQRYEGYKQALANYHLKAEERFIYDSDLNVESGQRIADRFMDAEGEHPTAMVIVNDMTAIGFIDECRKRGYRIPEDVSIVSFDNVWFSSMETINLTTISQHVEEMSRQAVRLLMKQLNGDRNNPERIILPPELVVRGSTCSAK